jgi:hypothetical protein
MGANESTPNPFDSASIEETVARVREMNERLLESSKSSGRVALDAYEKALRSMLAFEEKVADASQLDWVTALASAHAQFVREFSAVYLKAAREALA